MIMSNNKDNIYLGLKMYQQFSQMNKIFPIHLKIKLSVIYYTTC